MSIAVVPPPLVAEPNDSADLRERLTWYAAIARWAPSKHNSQPWRFVVHSTALECWSDPMRLLSATDPHHRELTLSCGAAVHLACVAARARGHEPHVEIFPSGPGALLARITEAGPRLATAQDRWLLAAVPTRRTDRGPLDGTQLPRSLAFLLQAAAAKEGATLRLVTSAGDRATLAGLVERADRLLAVSGDVQHELSGWLRETGDSRRDGVPTDHTRGARGSYRAEFVQRDFSTSHSYPAQDRDGADSPIVGILCTPNDRAEDWLGAGRALASVLLHAAAAGASSSYLNQPVEHAATRARLREQLTLPDVPQLVLRLGVGGTVTPTPRRSVDEVTFQA